MYPYRIKPPSKIPVISFRELWGFRNLLGYLIRRDIKINFSSTRLGGLWILVQPLVSTLILTIVLGRFAKIQTDAPYAILVLSALVPWTYINGTLIKAVESMISNAKLISKVYFPRLIIPIIPIVVSLLQTVFTVLALFVVALCMGITPTLNWLIIIPTLLLTTLLVLGVSLWITPLNVLFRDIGKGIPIILQLFLYASPIFYPASLIPSEYYKYYQLNPVVGIVETMRWAMVGNTAFPFQPLLLSAVFSLVVLASGIFFFYAMEDTLTDLV